MNIAIIGFGYWGPNLLRNFSNTKNCNVTYIVDLIPQNLEKINQTHSNITTTNSAERVFKDSNVDAVVIATEVSSHYSLAKMSLEHGKHVLIEKPMTNSVTKAKELIDLANSKKRMLMVDHTYLYTSAVQKMKELIKSGSIGTIQYIDSIRANLGIFQPDVNVLWDLAPHDIAICNYLIEEKPVSVQAIGKSHTSTNLEDIAYLTLHYNSKKIAHFNCSWISPVKIRQMLVGGDKKMIVFNDVESVDKIKVYDSSYQEKTNSEDSHNSLIEYHVGKPFIPEISKREGLLGVTEDFVRASLENKKPISDSSLGLEVVQILEAAQKSIKNHGKEISL